MVEEQRNILIIDDEERIRFLLKIILEEAGYSVVVAANGQEALDKLSQSNIKAVLLDIKMPGMPGIKVLKEITINWPDIPVIIVTGTGDAKAIAEAKDFGANDFIRKPFLPDSIVTTVRKVFQKKDIRQ